MKLFILQLIRWYQKILSPDHSHRRQRYPYGYCRFYPSCSEYGYRAIVKFGLFKGICKAIWRICRCHPRSSGGVDAP